VPADPAHRLVHADPVAQALGLGQQLAERPGGRDGVEARRHGEPPRTTADDEPDAMRRADGSWLVDGVKPLIEVEELLDDDAAFTNEDEDNYQTLGGYVMGRLDRIPRAGDHFESAGWRYEVMDMDGNRVDKVMISRVAGADSLQPTAHS
jgi:hypothetical protein